MRLLPAGSRRYGDGLLLTNHLPGAAALQDVFQRGYDFTFRLLRKPQDLTQGDSYVGDVQLDIRLFLFFIHGAAVRADVRRQLAATVLKGEPQPRNGFVELSEQPGFGYELDQDVLSGKAAAALIW